MARPLPDPVQLYNTGSIYIPTAELRVLDQLVAGRTNVEIAEALFLSVNTVKTHLQRMNKKTGATTRAGLVAWAFRSGVYG